MNSELTSLIESGIPGLVFASSHEGRRSTTSIGNRSSLDLASPLLMTNETSFDLGSLTKIIITTSALMDLVHEKKISLEDKISKYISQWNISEKSEVWSSHILSLARQMIKVMLQRLPEVIGWKGKWWDPMRPILFQKKSRTSISGAPTYSVAKLMMATPFISWAQFLDMLACSPPQRIF